MGGVPEQSCDSKAKGGQSEGIQNGPCNGNAGDAKLTFSLHVGVAGGHSIHRDGERWARTELGCSSGWTVSTVNATHDLVPTATWTWAEAARLSFQRDCRFSLVVHSNVRWYHDAHLGLATETPPIDGGECPSNLQGVAGAMPRSQLHTCMSAPRVHAIINEHQ